MVPESGVSRPAMIRSKVVFPEPDGPSNAMSPPLGTSRLTLFNTDFVPNDLLTLRMEMLMAARHRARRGLRTTTATAPPTRAGFWRQATRGRRAPTVTQRQTRRQSD